MTGSAHIVRGDALELPLADDSVDLVVTSPPYFGLRSYQDAGEHYAGQIGDEDSPHAFVDNLVTATSEMARVLKPGGSIFVNLGDKYSGAQQQSSGRQAGTSSADYWRRTDPKRTGIPNKSLMGIPWRYAIRCIDDLGLILRAEIIWSKPNGMPESCTDRVRRSHEQWFHFTKQPRYFAAVDEIREPASDYARSAARTRDDACIPPGNRVRKIRDTVNPLGKLPPSVWEIPTQPLKAPADLGIDHFAAFPVEWPLRLILGWSPPAGVVLDPFGGTGTTALAAKVLGRTAISVDMSADYCRLAEWRVNDPGQIEATRERARRHGHATQLTDTDDLGLLGLLEVPA